MVGKALERDGNILEKAAIKQIYIYQKGRRLDVIKNTKKCAELCVFS